MLIRNAGLRFLVPTMTIALCVPLCHATSESSSSSAPELSAAASYVLTPETFQKLLKAEARLAGVLERDNKLEKEIALKGDHDTFEAWVRRIQSNSKAVSAIQTTGLTAREYLKALVAVLQAYAVAGVQKTGKAVPDHLLAQVPSQNIAFVKSHSAEIESWGKTTGKLEKDGKGGGMDGAKDGGKAVKPNTLEDIYIPADNPPAEEPAPKDQTPKKP